MLKALINFRGVEVLSKEEQKYIVGKGTIQPRCKTWAPIGANAVNYPNYPCDEIYGDACLPTLLPDGTILEC